MSAIGINFDWVAPLVGAWIEITTLQHCDIEALVAPLVGAWIEINAYKWQRIPPDGSLLSWERGLKFNQGGKVTSHFGRSSRGSVD